MLYFCYTRIGTKIVLIYGYIITFWHPFFIQSWVTISGLRKLPDLREKSRVLSIDIKWRWQSMGEIWTLVIVHSTKLGHAALRDYGRILPIPARLCLVTRIYWTWSSWTGGINYFTTAPPSAQEGQLVRLCELLFNSNSTLPCLLLPVSYWHEINLPMQFIFLISRVNTCPSHCPQNIIIHFAYPTLNQSRPQKLCRETICNITHDYTRRLQLCTLLAGF